MNSPQTFQYAIIQTLYSQRQAIDAGFTVALEVGAFCSAGVGFQRDLDVICDPIMLCDRCQYFPNGPLRKQAGGTTAKKNTVNGALADLVGLETEIGLHGLQIVVFGQGLVQGV